MILNPLWFLLLGCLYASLIKMPPIKVFLVPHSHMDAGWLKTVDGYYYEQVRHIYKNTLSYLHEHQNYKFIIAEQYFFQRFYLEQSKEEQDKIHQLLRDKRLEFILDFVQSDEACTTQFGWLTQLKQARDFLSCHFPEAELKYGFQIDPFGHSALTPVLMRQLNMSGLVLNRIHYKTQEELQNQHKMKFIWEMSQPVERQQLVIQSHEMRPETESIQLKTHILSRHYSSPPGLNFEWDPEIKDEDDLKKRAEGFYNFIRENLKYYYFDYQSQKQLNFLQLIGDDFNYQHPEKQFRNWDKMISYMTEHYDLEMQYATLSDYFEAIDNEQLQTISNLDFFSYADNENSYWTGYYTSKPLFKQAVRKSENLLANAQSLLAHFHYQFPSDLPTTLLDEFSKYISVSQHHDAITGTAKEFVMQNYVEYLEREERKISLLVETSLRKVYSENLKISDVSTLNDLKTAHDYVWLFSLFYHEALEDEWVHFKDLDFHDLQIEWYENDEKRSPLKIEAVPSLMSSKFDVWFQMPKRSFSTQVFKLKRSFSREPEPVTKKISLAEAMIENELLKLEWKRNAFWLTNKKENISIELKAEPRFYRSYTGPGQMSGAYIFRPSHPLADRMKPIHVDLIKGSLVQELRIYYDSFGTIEVFRLFKGRNDLHVEIQMQEIETDREVVVSFGSDHRRHCQFQSDDQSAMIMNRHRSESEFPPANYFPSTSFASLSCHDHFLSVLTERSMAVGFPNEGELEFMIQRRTSSDDQRGVDEFLDDRNPTQTTFRVFLESKDYGLNHERIFTNSRQSLLAFGQQTKLKFPKWKVPNCKSPFPNWRLFSFQIHSTDQEKTETIYLIRYQKLYEGSNLNDMDDIIALSRWYFSDWHIDNIEWSSPIGNRESEPFMPQFLGMTQGVLLTVR